MNLLKQYPQLSPLSSSLSGQHKLSSLSHSQNHQLHNESGELEESDQEFESSQPFQTKIMKRENQIQQLVFDEKAEQLKEKNQQKCMELYEKQNRSKEQSLNPQRINLKQMLVKELEKNRKLEELLHCEEKKNIYFRQLINKLKVENGIVTTKLQKQTSKNKNHKAKIKQLEMKILRYEEMKREFSQSQVIQREIKWIKREDKKLRQVNVKYTELINGLSQSIEIVNGKKPSNVKGIWIEWKKILEEVNYYRSKYGRANK